MLAAEGGTQPPRRTGYDRPARNPHQSRSAIVAQHGIVATSQPLAAQAGLDVLKQGGNAADAAICADDNYEAILCGGRRGDVEVGCQEDMTFDVGNRHARH